MGDSSIPADIDRDSGRDKKGFCCLMVWVKCAKAQALRNNDPVIQVA